MNNVLDFEISFTKETLLKLRNNALYRLYEMAGMTYRDFADFWNLDHSQMVRIIEDRRARELKKKDRRK
jgi:hypothetical protein